LHDKYLEHQRSAWVRTTDAWVPYPFQNNLHFLSEKDTEECLEGLKNRPQLEVSNFADWIRVTFGDGIARHFMMPYNNKVWGTSPAEMDFNWIADRVSVIDYEHIKSIVRAGKADSNWGPNASFLFPRNGGTGEVFRRLAARYPDKVSYNKKMTRIDPLKREISFTDGTAVPYDILINTSPLDQLLEMSNYRSADRPPFRVAGGAIVGLGVEKPEDSGRCWVYFPDDPPCFYRLTYFSRYSPENVPGGDVGRYAAYMCETIFTPENGINLGNVVEHTLKGLRKAGIIDNDAAERVVSEYVIPVPYNYPVPVLGLRDGLQRVHRELEELDIYSRGRFGGWRYEMGNMDHSFLQGYEVVGRLTNGSAEQIWQW